MTPDDVPSPTGAPPGRGLAELDEESAGWLAALGSSGTRREQALGELHALLLRAARSEAHRRAPRAQLGGPELDDLAHHAAADAVVAITGKLHQFEGRSRFTTWAYKFVLLEVATKVGRHWWRRPVAHLDAQDWERLPDRFGFDPAQEAQGRSLLTALRTAVDTCLTPHQRAVFVAIVVEQVPVDALAARTASTRGALYKTLFDARRKVRAHLDANGYLEDPGTATRRT